MDSEDEPDSAELLMREFDMDFEEKVHKHVSSPFLECIEMSYKDFRTVIDEISSRIPFLLHSGRKFNCKYHSALE